MSESTSDSIFEEMQEQIAILQEDHPKVQKKNKAAGTRARKATLQLAKLGKLYRKATLDEV